MFLVSVLQDTVVQALVAVEHSIRDIKFTVLQINNCAGERLLSVQIVCGDRRVHGESSSGKNVIVKIEKRRPEFVIRIAAVLRHMRY